MQTYRRLLLTIGAFALSVSLPASTLILPMIGSKWGLYAHGGSIKCGVSTCKGKQYPGTLSNNQGIYFNFPNAPDLPVGSGTKSTDWRGYLMTTPAITAYDNASILTVRVEVMTTGNVLFGFHSDGNYECEQTPVTTRPHFKKEAWGKYVGDDYRWWAKQPYSFILADGEVVISIPLNPQYWIQTWGDTGSATPELTAAFNETISNIGSIGLAIGGGCSYGHAANISGNGTATFVLKSYSIQ